MSFVMSVSMPPEFRTETLRTLVAISDEGEIAVALRDSLPREMVVVLDARPAEAAAAIASCRPYPWAVVCDAPDQVPGRATSQPAILLARDAAPSPGVFVPWTRFGELVHRLRSMLNAGVGGMRLATGVGVELPDGGWVRSASLQSLVSAYPSALAVDATRFRSATRILASHGIAWRPRAQTSPAGTALVPVGAAFDPVGTS